MTGAHSKLCCQWQPLFEWLTANFPRDIPMPSLPGSKHPMYSHTANAQGRKAWSWDDVDFFVQHNSHKHAYDIGILLRDLCVVDADSKQLCEELEARFPVLGKVPCEATTKGCHYYFKRSPKADLHGFYDGRAQVTHGIDFKTVCKNGTSGFIVASPSQGKSWVRAPWECCCIPIPDDLLVAVARPHHQVVDAELYFPEDGSRLSVAGNAWLPRFEYMAPFFAEAEGFAHTGGAIPIGIGTASTMSELLWMCDHKRLQKWPTDLEAIRRLADYLGMPGAMQLLLSTWHPSSPCARAEALERLNPRWASVAIQPGNVDLIDVTTSQQLTYVPLQRDQQWLFHARDAAVPAFEQMLRPEPLQFAEESLPEPVLYLLRKHNRLLLAGGAALSVACDCVDDGADYDLFLWGSTPEEAELVKQDLLQAPGVSASTQTGAAITVIWGERDEVIQLITWLYDTPEHILDSFDLAPCKVALGCFGGDGGALQLRARAAWIESMRHMTLWVDLGCWSEASVARILKYYAKGFDVVLPGLNRRAFQVLDPITFPHQRGISNLFKVEALANLRMQLTNGPLARPGYADLHVLLRSYCSGVYKDSAYAEMIPSGIFARVVHSIIAAGMTWLGLGRPVVLPTTRRSGGTWQQAPARGCLFPASPRCCTAFKSMNRTDVVPVSNLAEAVSSGANTSDFVLRLCEPLRGVSRVEVFSLAAPPPDRAAADGASAATTYVLLTIAELGIAQMPVFYRCLHHPEAGITFTLDCNPEWHFAAPAVPLGPVDRLSVRLTRPDGSLFADAHVTMLLRVTCAPRQELLLRATTQSKTQTQLLLLDMANSSSYEFVASLATPLYNIEGVRLLGMRMPPLFIPASSTWEPYLELHIEELGIRWQVQHTWYFTNHDTVDWCVLPQHHRRCLVPPINATRLTARILSRINTGKLHTVTPNETCDRYQCCILLQVDRGTDTVLRWQVEQIRGGGDMLSAVFETMERIDPKDYDVALIEKQPTNRQMIRVESMIAMYLLCRSPASKVVVYSPAHKLKNVSGSEATRGWGKKQYAARKKLSVQAVSEWLRSHPQPSKELTQCFEAARKQDDFADALLQALSYTTPAAAAEPKAAAVRARRPTEKQLKKKAFSMPNLKWLIAEALKQPAQATTVVECFADPPPSEDEVRCMRLLQRMRGDANIAAALRRNNISAESAVARFGFV
ncbi:hypothetical protein OEZ85_011039 [Tetradesmus obliquus]|uniref:DNA primase/polymerase bifunctional N-terminal domain-containing protein n=1 Tax=Tetradesmus obliquus TaxID=3088 RepID=A0ABY8TP26_TETOB|nr:hypothetical protein OEZ85_011039 [Tetradesmus obliquus]